MKSQKKVEKGERSASAGTFLEFDWQVNKRISLGREFRKFSENSGTLSLEYRF